MLTERKSIYWLQKVRGWWGGSSLWERTCTLSQVSVITILLSGGYIFQRSSRPLEQFWLTLWCTSDRERERVQGKRRECSCLWEEKEEGVNERKEKPPQFLWVLLAVGYRMSAVAFLSVWEATAVFFILNFLFFVFPSLRGPHIRRRHCRFASLSSSSSFLTCLLLVCYYFCCHAGSWRSFQA